MNVARITKAPEERRKEIIDTAIKLFYEKGYEKTTISDIAKEINVAQGLCYRYFPSKEMLFDCAIDHYAQILADSITEYTKDTELSLKELIMKMPTFVDIEKENTIYYKLFHSAENHKIHSQLSINICSKLMPAVCDILKKAAERKEIVVDDIEAAASFAVYGQLGILLDESIPADERITRVKTFLLKIFNLI